MAASVITPFDRCLRSRLCAGIEAFNIALCLILTHIRLVPRVSRCSSRARTGRRIQIATQGAAGKTAGKAGCKTLKPLHPAGSNCEGCACSGHYRPWDASKKSSTGNQASKSTHECPLYDSHKVAAVHCGAGSSCHHSPQHTGNGSPGTPGEDSYSSTKEGGKEIFKKTEKTVSARVYKGQRVVSRISISVKRLR